MNKKEINWEEVDLEHKMHIKKCAEIDRIIAEKRKNPMKEVNLEKQTEIVNNFIKENELNSVILQFNIEKDNNKN